MSLFLKIATFRKLVYQVPLFNVLDKFNGERFTDVRTPMHVVSYELLRVIDFARDGVTCYVVAGPDSSVQLLTHSE